MIPIYLFIFVSNLLKSINAEIKHIFIDKIENANSLLFAIN
jgi:hypothetical protein